MCCRVRARGIIVDAKLPIDLKFDIIWKENCRLRCYSKAVLMLTIAEEVVEAVKYVRDSHWIAMAPQRRPRLLNLAIWTRELDDARAWKSWLWLIMYSVCASRSICNSQNHIVLFLRYGYCIVFMCGEILCKHTESNYGTMSRDNHTINKGKEIYMSKIWISIYSINILS